MNNINSNPNYSLCDFNFENVKISENLCLEKNNYDLLKCPICQSIPIFPKSCSKCECLICNRCLSNYSLNSNLCPNKSCNQKFSEKPMNRLVNTLLNNTLIKCPNTPNCPLEKKMVELLDHLLVCKYTLRIAKCVGCAKNISTTNELKEVNEHVKVCPSISEPCKFCYTLQARNNMTEHYKNCVESYIKCPDCSQERKRNDSHSREDCFNKLKNLYQNGVSKSILF
jgi:hypothetical protein